MKFFFSVPKPPLHLLLYFFAYFTLCPQSPHTAVCRNLKFKLFCVANYLTDFIFFFCNSTRRNSEWKVCDLFNSFLLNFALDFKRLLLVQVQNSAGNFKIGFVHGFPYFKRKLIWLHFKFLSKNSKKKKFHFKNSFI